MSHKTFTIPLFFNSSSNVPGVLNKSADGSSFSVQLNPSLVIPKEARNCEVSMLSWTGYNIFRNILAGQNNKLYFSDDVNNLTKYSITLDSGQYTLTSLDTEIKRLILAQGLGTEENPIISLSGDDATGKVVLTLANGWLVRHLSDSCTVSPCGFNVSTTSGPANSANWSVKANNVANFAQTSGLRLHLGGIALDSYVNGRNQGDLLSEVSISSRPYSLINFYPQHPIAVPAPNLAGQTISMLRIWVTNEQYQPVNMQEDWSTRISISYDV